MSAPPQLVAFHVGIVVRDLDATVERFKRMFGMDRWGYLDGATTKFAYGGREGTGMAIEVMQPGPDASRMLDFLNEHGEGVEHLGFWTPDLKGALQAAVDGGGKLLPGSYEARGSTVVEVEAPAGAPANPFRQIGFVDAGMGGTKWEIIGPPSDKGLRDWLKDDYDVIIQPTPW
jgi:catechol 2,3-dioxygenase-like lactoylglutathione lyase family enzyme